LRAVFGVGTFIRGELSPYRAPLNPETFRSRGNARALFPLPEFGEGEIKLSPTAA